MRDIIRCVPVLLLLVLLGMGCRGTVTPVEQRTAMLNTAMQDSFSCVVFEPQLDEPRPALVLALPSADEVPSWFESAGDMARLNFYVFLYSGDGDTTGARHESVQEAVEHYGDRINKAFWVGVRDQAMPVLQLAAWDSLIQGVALLTPVMDEGPFVDHYAEMIAGRPLIYIISSTSEEAGVDHRDLYERFGEPKKWVYLEEESSGTALLKTHVEPIIRRVLVLLASR